MELAKQKLIRKLDIKNSKGRHYYIITIWGLRKCLQEESIGKEPLEYQRSKDAEKIIKLIHEEYELEKTCSFSRALSISPSFIEALSEFNNIWEKPIIIRNKDIIKEMAVSSANIYVIGNSNTLHKRYILEHLPLIFLMKDISKYPQNRELKEAIVKGVIEIRNDKKPISIIKEDCFEHLYIYIPPFGESILACDGQCLRPCL